MILCTRQGRGGDGLYKQQQRKTPHCLKMQAGIIKFGIISNISITDSFNNNKGLKLYPQSIYLLMVIRIMVLLATRMVTESVIKYYPKQARNGKRIRNRKNTIYIGTQKHNKTIHNVDVHPKQKQHYHKIDLYTKGKGFI